MSDPTRLDGGAVTRLDPQNADGKTRLDQPPGTLTPAGYYALPSALTSTYRFVSAIPTQGAEADLFVIESLDAGQKFVLKLYRRGLKPKGDVIEMLRACSREHVVEIVSWGESDGLWYEILEYGAHGTLRDMFQKGSVKDAQMLEIIRELHDAIEHIHSHKIIHRDLKPENILVRTPKPLDLMLADFGIASLSAATQHFTTKSRTIKYGAPEAAAGAVWNASDYWSLGLIVLEGLTGKHPFDGLSDLSIAVQLATKGVDVVVKHARWKGLCKGLLTRDPKKRWSSVQVSEWLAGGMPEVAADELERPSQKPYKIAKRECWTAAELALEFSRNWPEGEKHLARNLVLPWLKDELRDQDAANLVIDLAENRSLSNEDRLVRLIANLGKGLPPVWRGISLDQATLVAMCRDALGDAEKAGQIESVFEKEVLDVWGQSGNEDCAQWNQLWNDSAREFPKMFKKIAGAADVAKSVPDQKTFLPVLLLLILSPEYRDAMRSQVQSFSQQAARCPWLAPVLKDDSFAALVALQALQEEVVALGNQEIRAAKAVEEAIGEFERDYADVLTPGSEFAREMEGLRAAIAENRAFMEFTNALPDLRRRLFEASRSLTVAQSFKSLRRKQRFEILADGLLVAALLVALRIWMGNSIADDGLGPIAARVSPVLEGHGEVNKYLLAGWAAVLLAWVGFRLCARLVAKKLFGK